MAFEYQDEYAQAWDNLSLSLESSYEQLRQTCLDEDDFNYASAIANRLRAFYVSQQKTKQFLNKKVAQAGADFFVETILFFLKLFNDVERLGLEISSERPIQRKRGALRPDISIWRGSELLAVVECKTQLGWQRNTWEENFNSREKRLKESFPNVKALLVVMSSLNWSGFGNNRRVGEQLFCCMDAWPTQLPGAIENNFIRDQEIHQLFAQISQLATENVNEVA